MTNEERLQFNDTSHDHEDPDLRSDAWMSVGGFPSDKLGDLNFHVFSPVDGQGYNVDIATTDQEVLLRFLATRLGYDLRRSGGESNE